MASEEETVSFDLGGTIFKVRRSLLEGFPSTMLARSASQEWLGGNSDKPIFIDRDADRFRYCLDYMRDGTVHLPFTQSKSALLKDMEYYGFEGVDPMCICVDFPAGEAVNCLKSIEDAMLNEISQAELKVRHMHLALACVREYTSTKQTKLDLPHGKRGGGEPLYNSRVDWNLLNDCLKKYKLQAKRGRDNWEIIVELLVN